MATGESLTYVSSCTTHIPLPKPAEGRPPPLRPWCVDCKRMHDAHLLDTDGRCARCARAIITRAAAAQRRLAAQLAAPTAEATPAKTVTRSTVRPTRRPAPPKAPRAASQSRPPRPRTPRAPSTRGVTIDENAAVAEYLAGDSTPVVARRHGVAPKRIRDLLIRRRVELRDDRATKSGGKPHDYPDSVIAEVCHLYVDEQMSRSQVAAKVGIPYKSVVTIMTRQGIEARRGQTGRQDGARGLKDQLAALGVTSRQVKDWALGVGLVDEVKVGLPSAHLVTAYAERHRREA